MVEATKASATAAIEIFFTVLSSMDVERGLSGGKSATA
jgi:hypothetical protein